MYMNSVRNMYNEQMERMQQKGHQTRIYDYLKAPKSKDMITKSFNSFSMNNYKSMASLRDIKDEEKSAKLFLKYVFF